MARKRIGVQTVRLEYGYGVKQWQGAIARAEELDVDVILFPGRNLEAPHGFDYQYNRIFSLMSRENLDALVLATTLISNYVDGNALLDFCSRFKGLPLVSIGVQIPGVPSVLIDNRSGVRELVRHFAVEHGSRRIAFVKGPENNWEAAERFSAYREELEARGIPFDEGLTARGDFTQYSVPRAIDEILGQDGPVPEAIIFANDEMAIKGMQILKEKGLSVPESIAIAGFDDIMEAATQATPLTTVNQPQFEMGRLALQMAMDAIEGKRVPETTVLAAEPVIRSSCGCFIRRIEDLEALERGVLGSPREAGPGPDRLGIALSAFGALEEEGVMAVQGRKEPIEEAFSRLCSLCDRNADGDGKRDFISWLGGMLKEEGRAGKDPSDWELILPVLEDTIARTLADSMDAERLHRLVRAALVFTAEMSIIRRNDANYRENGVHLALREVQYGLSSIMHVDDLSSVLKDQLPRLGVSTFLLSQYENEWIHAPNTPWAVHERSKFLSGSVDGEELRGIGAAAYSSVALLPPSVSFGKKRRTLAVFPLFFRESHLGTVLFEVDPANGFIYESLAIQISGIMKTVMLFQGKEKAESKLRQALEELEGYNAQLSFLSLSDDLTGLYNRRGFMKLASQQLSLTRQMEKKALLVFADIDGLKGVNDTYGHDAGDRAIASVAVILRKTFRAMDIIARIGGDEFTVFVPNADEALMPVFQSRISSLLEEANSAVSGSYALSISVGFVSCGSGTPLSLEEYLHDADEKLYERKRMKKKPENGKDAEPRG
jgi:diguanylate cyclase (GGDEF)-like protein